jgi:hypothetical protein
MSDDAEKLALEAEGWLKTLSGKGIIPRAFIGITDSHYKFMFILDDSRIDPKDRVDFFRWLCRTERVATYVYVTRVGRLMSDHDPNAIEEVVDVYASSKTRDMNLILKVERHSDESVTYTRDHFSSRPASDRPGLWLGLQRSAQKTDEHKAAAFATAWREFAPTVVWLKRSSLTIALRPSTSVPGLKDNFEHYQECWNRGQLDGRGNLVLDEEAKIWENYDKAAASEAFTRSGDDPALFELLVSRALETECRVIDPLISTSKIRDKWVTTVSIWSDRIKCVPPVRWPPPADTLKAIVSLLGHIEGREWVEYWIVD